VFTMRVGNIAAGERVIVALRSAARCPTRTVRRDSRSESMHLAFHAGLCEEPAPRRGGLTGLQFICDGS
jgi:hypothetical protein